MNDFSKPSLDTLSSFGKVPSAVPFVPRDPAPVDQKAQNVERSAQVKEFMLASGGDTNRIATAILEGNDLGNHPVAQAIANGMPGDLERWYGPDMEAQGTAIRREMARLQQRGTLTRSGGDQLGDTARNIGAGVVGGLGGTLAFGAGLVNDEAGGWLASQTNRAASGLRDSRSNLAQLRTGEREVRSSLDQEDTNSAYIANRAAGDQFAGLKRFGKGAARTAQDLYENPEIAGDLTAEGIGSFFASGGIGKLAATAGMKILLKSKGLSGEAATKFLKTPEGIQAMSKISERSMMASIGALEGGGAYAQVQGEIQAMSEDELMEDSPEYAQLRQAGESHEQARNAVANRASLEAGGLQGVIGAGAGKLVAKFEANPMASSANAKGAVAALKELGSNSLKEAAEEAAQGISGEVVSGYAIKRNADPDRDPLENLGQVAVEGAVAGTGMAAAIGGPSTAVRVGGASLGAAGQGVRAAASARAESMDRKDEEESGVGKSAVKAAGSDIGSFVTEARKAKESTQPTEGQTTSEQDTGKVAPTQTDRIVELGRITGDEMNALPEGVMSMVNEEGETIPEGWEALRSDILDTVIQEIESGRFDDKKSAQAALWLSDQAQRLEGFRSLDLEALAEENPALAQLAEQALGSLDTILASKTVTNAIRRASSMTSKDLAGDTTLPQITDENANSPAVQKAVRQQGLLATSNPAGVDPAFLDQVLTQRKKLSLPEGTVQALSAAKALVDAMDLADADKARLESTTETEIRSQKGEGAKTASLPKTFDIVRAEALTSGRKHHNDFQGQPGASVIVSRILQAAAQGNMTLAQQIYDRNLGNLAEHFVNKAKAAKESAQLNRNSDNQIPFRTWSGQRWITPEEANAGFAFVNPGSPMGRMFAREMEIDARTMKQIYERVGQAVPGLKTRKLGEVPQVLARTKTEQSGIEAAATTNTNETARKVGGAQTTKSPSRESVEAEGAQGAAEAEGQARADEKAESDAAASKPERRIRKDAVLKTSESLIDTDDTGDRTDGDQEGNPKAKAPARKKSTNTPAGKPSGKADPVESNTGSVDQSGAGDTQGTGAGESGDSRGTGDTRGTAGQDGATSRQDSQDVDPAAEARRREAKFEAELKATEKAELDEAKAKIEADAAKGVKRPGDDKSYLEQAFNFDPAGSIAIRSPSPLKSVINLLKNWSTLDARLMEMFPAEKLGIAMDQSRANEAAAFFDKHGREIMRRMKANLGKPNSGFKKMTPVEALNGKTDKGVPFTELREGLNLQLLDPETGDYLPRFLESAVLAAMHWALSAETIAEVNTEQVAKMFGKDEVMVTAADMALAQQGFNPTTAKEMLAREIETFWGAQRNRSIPSNRVRGITEALAADLLDAMNGILTESVEVATKNQKLNIKTGTIEKTDLGQLRLGHPSTRDEVRELGARRRFLGKALLREEETPYALDVKPPRKHKAQKGNPLSRHGTKTDKAIEAQRNQAFTRNTPFVEMNRALGRETWLKLRGHQPVESRVMNVRHKAEVEGRNRTLEMSWDRTIEHDDAVLAHAEATGKSPDQVSTFFDWVQVASGRIMARGHNPQADKFIREALVLTKGVLDMTKLSDRQKFWLTVGQSADVVKAELQRRAPAARDAETKIRAAFPKTIGHMAEMWNRMDAGESAEFTAEVQAEIVDEIQTGAKGGVASDKLLHALMMVGKHDYVRDGLGEEDAAWSSFESALSLEADGKTNGPFMAMMLFLAKPFSGRQLGMLQKGGFFPNMLGQTLNAHFEKDKAGDLYETAGALAEELKAQLRARLKMESPAADRSYEKASPHEQAERIDRLLRFLGDLEVKTDDTGKTVATIGRKSMKNPLTITIYGSGAKGIAGKIAAAVADELGRKMTKVAETQKDGTKTTIEEVAGGYTQLVDDLKFLTTQRTVHGKFKDEFYVTNLLPKTDFDRAEEKSGNTDALDLRKVSSPENMDPQSFELTSGQMIMLRENIQSLVVDPMVDAIETVTDGVGETMSTIQRGTQVQSIVFRARMRAAVRAMIAEKVKAGELRNDSESLSEDDYQKVFKDMARFGAVIETVEGGIEDLHHLHMSGLESSRSKKDDAKNFSRSLDNQFSGEGTVKVPGEAGVSAMPLMTISRGDAMMMINYFAAKEAPHGLQVYDGLEIAPDMIDEISERMNQSVIQTIFDNPLRDVADGWADWVRQVGDDPFKGMEPGTETSDVLRAFGYSRKDTEALSSDEAQAAMLDSIKAHKQALETLAQQAEARRTVLKSMGFSMDQMASAESPANYGTEDDLIAAENDSQLAAEMNRRYEAALAEIREKAGQTRDVMAENDAETPETGSNPAFGERMRTFSTQSETHPGVRRMKRKQILHSLRGDKDGSPEQARMIRLLTDRLANKLGEFELVFGDEADLISWRGQHHPLTVDKPTGRGWIDLDNGVIYIANLTRETVMHELLHAVTAATIYAHAGNIDRIKQDEDASADAKAVSNLSSLMDSFMKLDFGLEDKGTREAGIGLQREIREALADDNRGKALMEFVAWTLSNQNLIAALRKTRARSRLVQLGDKILAGIKRLLGIESKERLDMFSNIAWNTAAVVQLSQPRFLEGADTLTQRSSGRRAFSGRLSRLDQLYEGRIASEMRKRDQRAANTGPAAAQTIDTGIDVLVDFEHVYQWPVMDRAVFARLVTALSGSMETDSRLMIQLERMFKHVVKNLDVEDFREIKDPAKQKPGDPDEKQAQERYQLVLGLARPAATAGSGTKPTDRNVREDNEGRRTTLAAFLALSQVDPDFRKTLEKMPLPEGTKKSRESLDASLESMGTQMMERLSDRVVRTAGRPDVAMDRLAQRIGEIEFDTRSEIEKQAMGLADRGDAKVSGMFNDMGEWLVKTGKGREAARLKQDRHIIRDGMSKMIESSMLVTGSLLNEQRGKNMAEALVSLSNNAEARTIGDDPKAWNGFLTRAVPSTVWSLIRESIGMTDSNRGVLEMMNRVKYAISGVRQDYREMLPEQLKRKFKKAPDEQGWTDMYEVFMKTDLSALGTALSTPGSIVRMLRNSSARQQMMVETRNKLSKEGSQAQMRDWDKGARDLAKMLVTGKVDTGNHRLRKNATAIYFNLANGGSRNLNDPITRAEQRGIDMVDRLTTLYALDLQSKENPQLAERISEMSKTEEEGMAFALAYTAQLREMERQKATSGAAKANMWKGYAPAESAEGMKLIVAENVEYGKKISTGYTKVGDYSGSGLETKESAKMSYFLTNVGGKGTYVQGIMQTVQKTAGGVDIYSGHTLNSGHVQLGGRIRQRDFDAIHESITTGKYKSRGDAQALVPVLDATGQVVDYERTLDPVKLEGLRRNMRLDEMVGAWAGRQAEEAKGEGFNRLTVDRLKENWDKGKKGPSRNEYVDLSDSDARAENKVWEDAWEILPAETKSYIQATFGKDGFMVRRDLIDNAMGYRMMTIGSPWKDNSNMDPETSKAIRETVQLIMGRNAYKNLVTAEKYWQAGISVAKETIVIRSVIVPVANLVSNVLQLGTAGVPMRLVGKGFRDGLVEIDAHLKRQGRRAELDAEMAFAEQNKDIARVRRLTAERATLKEADQRMTIWPLIEAGEFSTISEGLTDADAAIQKGRLAETLSGYVDKLPSQLGTAGKYAFVTRDTALFKGMSRAVMYGDFLAKAVMYEHLTKRGVNGKKLTHKQALDRVTEEFVNYNLLPGRVRNYAESIGLAWFWSFKLRSMKVAHRMIRDNPLRALMTSVGTPWLPDVPGVDVGSPITDNAYAVISDGRAGYSMGLNMLWSAPTLNPWYNMAN